MLSKFLRRRVKPAKLSSNAEEILLQANALFGAEQGKDLQPVIAEKTEDLRRYDVLAMDRAVAILSWGRSGSLFLASYFDGHEDVIMLPELCGWKLYEFFDRYPSLALGDKLLAYPAYEPDFTRFFQGDFAISLAQYYAAVQAILEFYREWPADFRESRRAFFLFVHIAYDLALGRRPASSHPLIVYAQHLQDNASALRLVEDFPQAKFVHTVRDPISTVDRTFHHFLGSLADRHIVLPYSVLNSLISDERPHLGMESRTRTVRFEDLHSDTAETMRNLSVWLGLPFQPALLHSTFNGLPYVVSRDGVSWSGRRLEKVRRHSQYLSSRDQALMFASVYENFVEWNYPCPRIFGYPIVRFVVLASLVLFPTKMEITGARAVFKHRIAPALRQGNILRAITSFSAIAVCRLKIIRLLVAVFIRRRVYGARLLQVDHKEQPLDRCDDGVRALTET